MFTFGIFTTHFPYVVFVVFYAYFLIFGVEQAHDGKIQVAEKSIQIEYHVNHSHATAQKLPAFYYQAEFDFESHHNCDNLSSNQKWKVHQSLRFYAKDILLDSPFCRPPPTLA
nr:hypothetical protein [uncultured Draconibacterium sp.]